MDGVPRWAALTIWLVVNAVNVLQSAGFLSRTRYGMSVNEVLGYLIALLAIPATVALIGFVGAGSGWIHLAGPLAFDAFVVFHAAVSYVWSVEFRDPLRPEILVPYLVLFFGSIFLMGVPMFRLSRPLWGVTVLTTVMLLGSMLWAIGHGVG
jgi:hypothetical protein